MGLPVHQATSSRPTVPGILPLVFLNNPGRQPYHPHTANGNKDALRMEGPGRGAPCCLCVTPPTPHHSESGHT